MTFLAKSQIPSPTITTPYGSRILVCLWSFIPWDSIRSRVANSGLMSYFGLKGVLVSIVFLMAGLYLAQGYDFSRTMKLVFAGLCILVMFALRWFVISRYQTLRKMGFNLRRTLVVGADRTAAIIHKELSHHRELGFDIVGFVREPGNK